MPISLHSHSGQFCAHASNSLEEMVQSAIAKKMRVYALTEHMPRGPKDLYPEEIAAGQTSKGLEELFDNFIVEATRLRDKYSDQITILIGFESEWIHTPLNNGNVKPDTSSLALVQKLQKKHRQALNLFIGSVHHVHQVPIDYSRELYLQARTAANNLAKGQNYEERAGSDNWGNLDEALFINFFDAQYDMLRSLKPPVIGHFDLIRLYSDRPDDALQSQTRIWKYVTRNLEYISGYGGILEINSSAVRKGLREPYPQLEICKAFLRMGGKFTISDDSHRVDDIGLNYHVVLDHVKQLGVHELFIPEETSSSETGPGQTRKYEIHSLLAPLSTDKSICEQ